MATPKDLYAILGVERSASAEEIKKAYRRLARTHHPDVNAGDKSSEEKFKEISGAFEVLGDADKRKLYDEFGHAALRKGFKPEQARANRHYTRAKATAGATGATKRTGAARGARAAGGAADPFADFRTAGSPFGTADFTDFSDIFRDFSRRTSGRRVPTPGADIESTIDVELKEAALGGERIVSVERPSTCDTCKGSGNKAGAAPVRCTRCKGKGSVTRTSRGKRTSTVCPQCHGTGAMPVPPCPTCRGTGAVVKPVRLSVRIPKGVEEGSRIRVAGQGGVGTLGGAAGDLYLTVRLLPHPRLRREGNDLYLDVPVTVREALEGAEIPVPTFEGRVGVRVPAGSQSGHKLRLKGKGLPTLAGKQGDLYFVIQVRVPKVANEAALLAARALDAAYEGELRAGLEL